MSKTNKPLVTISVISYNQEKYLPILIESILNQTYDNIELFVNDDASTDNTAEVVERYKNDKRFHFSQNTQNLGAQKNAEKAFHMGNGKYKMVFGADDFLDRRYVETMVNYLEENPHCAVAYCPATWVNEEGRPIKVAHHIGHPKQLQIGGRNEVADLLVFDNYINPCTVIIRNDILQKFDPIMDLNGPAALDWDLYVRIALENNNFIFVPDPLSFYRIHGEQISQKSFYNTIKPLQIHIFILSKILKHPKVKELLTDRKEEIIQHLLRRYDQYKHFPEAKKLEKEVIRIQNELDSLTNEMPHLQDKTPLVSVILTTYNRRDLLRDAIRSVLEQTYTNFELLVVNDAGEDVNDITDSFNDKRIKLFTHRFNSGLPFARNTALRFIQGEIVTYLDDDDLYMPHHLQTVVNTFVKTNAAVVFTGSIYVDETIKDGKRTIVEKTDPFGSISYSKERLHIQNFIPVNAWAHRAQTVQEVGYFDESLRSMEDWEYLLRLSRKYDFQQVNETTVEVRRRVDNADNMLRREGKSFYDIYKTIYERYDNLGNFVVEKERENILRSLGKSPAASFKGKFILYLNHPYDTRQTLYFETPMIDGLNYLDEYKIVSIWKNDGENFEFDYNLINQSDYILVHNRGALFSEAILKLKAYGKKILYLIDFNPFKMTTTHSAYHYYKALRPRVETILNIADKVITSSELLKEQIAPQAHTLKIGANLELWTQKVQKEQHKKIRIAYITDINHVDALRHLRVVFDYLKEKYAKKVEIHLYGLGLDGHELVTFDDLKIIRINAPSYAKWVEYLRTQSIDIALLSSNNDAFAKSLNGYELLEYSLSNIALIAANTTPYSDFIEHGKTGYLCGSDLNDWKKALDILIKDEKKRIAVSNNAFKKVIDNYTVQHNAASWREIIDSVATDTTDKIERQEFQALQLQWKKYDIASMERYPAWLEQKRFRTQDITIWAKEAEEWTSLPHFTFFLFHTSSVERLHKSIESIMRQVYPKWHIIILTNETLQIPQEEKIDVVTTDINLFEAFNALILGNDMEWIVPLYGGDVLEADLLAIMTQLLNEKNDLGFIYCDNGHIDELDIFNTPFFKPDLNIDMLRSFNYIDETFAIHKAVFEHVGGVDTLLLHNELYDLTFKAIEVLSEGQIYHIDEILWHKFTKKADFDTQEIVKASAKLSISKHLQRQKISAEVIDGNADYTFRVLYYHDTTPLVSIIIPTKDQPALLKTCIDTLIEKTTYKNYEILIVDNQSKEDATLAYFDELQQKYDFVHVIPYDKDFNYSEANNIAAKQAKGEYLLFLNNDTEVTQENWLDVMMSYAQRDEVGIVGPRLLFPNNTIQHAGVCLGITLPAQHTFGGEKLYVSGYMNRLQIDQNLSAVTGACLLISKQLFDNVEGFNQKDYILNFSDIDLCLKACEAKKKIVWTPFATLYHHESQTIKYEIPKQSEEKRKLYDQDFETFIEMWYDYFIHDPAYNKNLLNNKDMLLINIEDIPHWNRFTKKTEKFWAFPRGLDGGGEYRVISPMTGLDKASYIQAHIAWSYYRYSYIIEKFAPTHILMQTPLHDAHINFIEQISQRTKAKLLFEIDDLLDNVPKDNPAYGKQHPDIKKRLKNTIKMCDKLIVSTKPLQDAYGKYAKDSAVVANYLRKDIWLPLKDKPKRFRGKKIRVGWAGAMFHTGDLSVITDVVKELKDKVEWVFMGLAPKGCESFIEYHEPVPLREYPQKLATLDLDLAVVPLQLNPFNDAKSNLRLLEFGIFGWSVIASDAYPYRDAPVTLVDNTKKAWIDAIEAKISDKEKLVDDGEKLREWVLENYMLEDHLDTIYKGYIS